MRPLRLALAAAILIVAGIAVLIFLVYLFIFFSFIRLWIQALLTKAEIGIGSLIGMKLRNVDYAMIVRQKIALVQAGVRVTTADLESPFLARGNVPKTATAVIAAHKAGLDLPWRTAAAIDLAGRDVLGRGKTGSGKTLAFSIPMIARLSGKLAGGRRRAGRPDPVPGSERGGQRQAESQLPPAVPEHQTETARPSEGSPGDRLRDRP